MNIKHSSDPNNQTLEQKIEEARSWALGLGAIFLVSSILQILGFIDADVPGWFNLLVSIAVIALGLSLTKQSVLLAGILCILFLAIIIDTLMSTRYVLNHWGFLPTILVLIRYVILVNAARSIGRAMFSMAEEQRITKSFGALKTDSEDVHRSDGSSATSKLELSSGTNWGVVLAGFGSTMALFGSVLFWFLIPDTTGRVYSLLMMAGAIFGAYGAIIEKNYLPKLVAEYRDAVLNHNTIVIKEKVSNIARLKGRGSRALGIAILKTPDGRADDTNAFKKAALKIIKDIGILDRDVAHAIRMKFVGENDKSLDKQVEEQVKNAAIDMLEVVGQ